MRTESSLEQIFTRVALLRGVPRRQLLRLARQGIPHRYPPGGVIIREGDTGMSLYVVLAGRVRIGGTAAGGTMTTIEAGPADYFGEAVLIDDQPRATTVVALESTLCAALSRRDVRAALRGRVNIRRRLRDLRARLRPAHHGE